MFTVGPLVVAAAGYLLPSVSAATPHFEASSFVGETVSAVYPPPSPSNTGAAFASFFPDATVVGFAGPTPSASRPALPLNHPY